ncbi:hypothetical protein E2F47_08130 [Mycobacterium eburneum]|nr:hypothetical protein [Mycobacterium eburneum]TDH56216.1 hypothetical protein E2F47_08130 [Mycobacterium eburneum]
MFALAGCGGGTHHGAATSHSTSSSTTVAPDRASADALPKGFPSDVPVVKGTIQGKYDDVVGDGRSPFWYLTVTGVDASSYDKAEQLLLNAGFSRDQGRDDHDLQSCGRHSEFTKLAAEYYDITLCGNDTGSGYQLKYNVFLIHDAGPTPVPPPTLPPFEPTPPFPN